MKLKERLTYFALEGSKTLVMFRKTLVVLSILFIGCANLGRIASDTNQTYDFRKTRWGFTQERVRLTEQGKRMHLKKGNVVIYNHSIDNIQCKIVYTFKNNKLRAAGYITDKPVKGAQKIITSISPE